MRGRLLWNMENFLMVRSHGCRDDLLVKRRQARSMICGESQEVGVRELGVAEKAGRVNERVIKQADRIGNE